MDASVARDMWLRLEPIHATVYFAPEARSAYADIGLKGYWMGYFASRSAAFGEATAEVVMATFYNFSEVMVRRAIPDAWTFSTPEAVLAARNALASTTTIRAFDGHPLVAEAADIAEAAARAARPEGRPLFAAHASLPWPDEPHLRLWHAATLLREHRGDGHVAMLVAEGVDGVECHVQSTAAKRADPAAQRSFRGISEEEWAAAEGRLRARGLLDDQGAFTEEGRAQRDRIERRTDELALPPYEHIGAEACARLIELLDEAGSDDAIPYPNAMALPQRGA